ncbi:LysR substrate-binding domain-containing protein [soil metagenome]
MDLIQLEYFLRVIETGSFSRAAVALDLAQPSLSRRIAALETELGQRLLTRTGRGAVPTEAGSLLAAHARTLLDAAQRARDELRELDSNPSGRVVIGIPPRVALGLSARLVQAFRERYPRAVVTVLEGLSVSLRESLIAGRLDLALLFDPAHAPQLRYEPVMRERLVMVAPPGTLLPQRIRLARLADYPMVLPSAPNAIRSLVDATLESRGITLSVIAEVGAVQTVRSLVAKGVGCTILPESALGAAGIDLLPKAAIGPPTIWNSLVLATPLARPATRLTREAARMLRTLDFRDGIPDAKLTARSSRA